MRLGSCRCHGNLCANEAPAERPAGIVHSTRDMRLREFMPTAADQARQRSTSSFSAAHLISRLRTVLRLGRQVCLTCPLVCRNDLWHPVPGITPYDAWTMGRTEISWGLAPQPAT